MAISPIFWWLKKPVVCQDPNMVGCHEWNYFGIIIFLVFIFVIVYILKNRKKND
ncbi:MAG: hypothetical protein ISS48_04085 [Candidatus Aenigmarchaeota archaeon]|nr:hypothetical protein [Candidatus Aenigmarchaeota archaeon]